jgi:hypothetical protein
MKISSKDAYEPALRDLIDAAVSQLCDRVGRSMPLSGASVLAWMRQLAGGSDPASYYHHARGSPMFLFPWALEASITGVPDLPMQFDLVYSTVSGYYWIRLIDNLTDNQSTNELDLLPALGLFHTEFQRPYQSHFGAGHPFWEFFRATWFHSADVTMEDLHPGDVDREQFVQVAAQKICAIKIPLAALCYHHDRADLLLAWSRFVDLFGCWHQMSNDLFHWYEDYSAGTLTYFLAEAERCKRRSESIAEWVTREGFAWGLGLLDAWMYELQVRAKELQSPHLTRYLKFRDTLLHRDADETLDALQLASGLKDIFF